MKFLMDQNSVLIENMASKPISGDKEFTERNLTSTHGQRGILTPEVSHLITNVNELANTVNELALKNVDLVKMSRVPENNLGLYQM